MSNQKNDVRRFVEKHSIRVLDTNKRASKITRLNHNLFRNPNNLNEIYSEPLYIHTETEPLYTVEIAESELERIAQFEQQVFNNLEEHGHYNLFEILMQQKEEEKHLINSYPAVKKAYEHYSLLLNLAKSGNI